MNKKRDIQEKHSNEHKNIRRSNKADVNRNKIPLPELNDPHARDMDDGNGEVLGGRI